MDMAHLDGTGAHCGGTGCGDSVREFEYRERRIDIRADLAHSDGNYYGVYGFARSLDKLETRIFGAGGGVGAIYRSASVKMALRQIQGNLRPVF